MRLEKLLDRLIDIIKTDDYFADIKVMKAYPCAIAPTRILKDTVALGIEGVELLSVSVDDSNRAGDISVFADIFIPVKKDNGKAYEIFTELCRCLCIFNVIRISAQRIAVDANTASYVLKTVITFNDEIEVV